MALSSVPFESNSFKVKLDALKVDLCVTETEESWHHIAESISTFTTLCVNHSCSSDVIQALRPLSRPLIDAMNSERTRLSGAALDLLSNVAGTLGKSFEPLLSTYFPAILILCGRTNKVTVTRARACVISIIESTQLPSLLPHLLQFANHKAASLRIVVVEGVLTCLNCFNPPDLEVESRARDIETVIRSNATDANADVRKFVKKIFEGYKMLMPGRVQNFTGPLAPTVQKYLQIKVPFHANQLLLPSNPLNPKSGTHITAQPVLKRSESRHILLHSSALPHAINPSGTVNTRQNAHPDACPKSVQAVRQLPASRSTSNRITSASHSMSLKTKGFIQEQSSSRRLPERSALVVPGPSNPDGPKRLHSTTTAFSQTSHTGPQRIRLPVILKGPDDQSSSQELLAASNASKHLRNASLKRLDSDETAKTMSREPPKKATKRNLSKDIDNRLTRIANGPTEYFNRRGVTKPTLSQLARVVDARSKVSSKAVTKPVWGKSAPRTIPPNHSQRTKSAVHVQNDPPLEDTTPVETTEIAKHSINEKPAEVQTSSDNLSMLTPRPNALFETAFLPSSTKTPISALLSSIEHGFDLTPSSPLSPPETHLMRTESTCLTNPMNIPFSLPICSAKENRVYLDASNSKNISAEGAREALGYMDIN